MAHRKFQVPTEPHVAEVGEYEFRFVPEPASVAMLAPYERLVEIYSKLGPSGDVPPDQVRPLVESMRELVSALMLPESQELFAKVSLSDAVVAEIMRWLMEVYGDRPTTPSSDSSPSASTNGAASTDASPREQDPIPSTGVSQGS